MSFVLQGEIANRLLCKECGCYLSIGPVKIVSGKGAVCGRCSKDQKGALSKYNILTQNALFSCNNRSEGCPVLLRHSEVVDHEKVCTGKVFVCGILSCSFKGTGLQLLAHFKSSHERLILTANEVTIDLEKSFETMYLYEKDDRFFYLGIEYSPISRKVFCFIVPIVGISFSVPVNIKLKAFDGEVKCESGISEVNKEIVMDLQGVKFPREIVVLLFEIEIEKVCVYIPNKEGPKSVNKNETSNCIPTPIQRVSVSTPNLCQPTPAISVTKLGDSFTIALHDFKKYSGDFRIVPPKFQKFGMFWELIIVPTYQNNRTLKLLTINVHCTAPPALPKKLVTAILQLSHIISSQTFICGGGTTMCVFHNFASYSDIYQKDILTNGTLKFQLSLSLTDNIPLAQPVASNVVSQPFGQPSNHVEPVHYSKVFERCFSNISQMVDVDSKDSSKHFTNKLGWSITIESDFEKGVRMLGIFLCCSPNKKNVHWSCKTEAKVTLIGSRRNITKSLNHTYHGSNSDQGFSNFLKWDILMNRAKGYLENDSIRIQVELNIINIYIIRAT